MEHGMNGSPIEQGSIIDHDGSSRSTVIESNAINKDLNSSIVMLETSVVNFLQDLSAERVNGSGSTVVEKDENNQDLNSLSIGSFDDTVVNLRRQLNVKNDELKNKLRAAISQRDLLISDFNQQMEFTDENNYPSANTEQLQYNQFGDVEIEELKRELNSKEEKVMTIFRSMISARDNMINDIDQHLGGAEEGEYDVSVGNRADKNAQIEELKLALEKKTAEANEHFLTEKSLRAVISMHKKDLEHEREENKKLTETVSQAINKLRYEKARNDQLNSKLEELSLQSHEDTLRMSIPNISMMKEKDRKYSISTLIAGMNWEFAANKSKEDNTEYLSIFLRCKNSDSGNWSCTVVSKVRLMALDGRSKNLEYDLYYTYKKSRGYGFPTFISWKSLLDESQGYVKNDTIILEVAMRVYPQPR